MGRQYKLLFFSELLNRQIVLDGIPSTNELYSFLIKNSILDKQKRREYGACFSHEDEHFLVNVSFVYRPSASAQKAFRQSIFIKVKVKHFLNFGR